MHIGALCPSGRGHVNPMSTLCSELVSRGHRVTIMVPPDGEKRVRAFGLDSRPVAVREFPYGSMDAALEELGMLSGREARRYTLDLFLRMTAGTVRDAPRIIEDMGIEGLIVDQTFRTGPTIAEHAGIPFVTLCAALLLNAEPGVPPYFSGWTYRESLLARWRNRIGHAMFRRLIRPIQKAIADQRAEWGLPKLSSRKLSDSPIAQLCQAPRAFDYPRQELPPQMHYVGPLQDPTMRPHVPFDFSRLDGRPLIYASMGSLQNKLSGVFEIIARATAGLDAQVVLSFGREDARIPDELPGSPIAVKYAPQLELIERASLVITHAGMNTAMESLAHGVPMVAIPVTNDQPAVAARVAWTGAGEMLPLDRLSVARLRAQVRGVLENGSYRENAQRIRSAINGAGGVRKAADIVEAAIGQNKPIPARS